MLRYIAAQMSSVLIYANSSSSNGKCPALTSEFESEQLLIYQSSFRLTQMFQKQEKKCFSGL